MTDNVTEETRRETGSGTDLWRVILAPVVWSAHFLVCYVGAAIYCEKLGREADLDTVRILVAIATSAGLAVIAASTRGLWRVRGRSLTDDDFDFEYNSAEERHRFLSHVALMLSALSAIGMIYVALPAFLLGSCR
jgi:uncharacterized membrane protein YbhN (UPF0104 family)